MLYRATGRVDASESAPSTRIGAGLPHVRRPGDCLQALADVWRTRQGAGGGGPSAMSVTMDPPFGCHGSISRRSPRSHCSRTSAALAQSSAQAPPADPQSPAAPPVFRTGSELVRVDVRVTDDQGHPVTDLRSGEVKLEEKGKPRPVVFFQHIAAPLGTYTEAAQRTIGAEVSTNQGAPQGHIYVLVFDEVHIRSGHEQRARLAAERFLRYERSPGRSCRVVRAARSRSSDSVHRGCRARAARASGHSRLGRRDGWRRAASVNPMGTFEAYEITRGNQVILDRQTNQASQNLQSTDTRNSNLTKSPAAALLDDPLRSPSGGRGRCENDRDAGGC